MSTELELRTAVLEKILKMHDDLLWPCIDRWIAWRPTDHLVELRRLRAQHNPDAAIRLRLPSLDDPSFFFWSIFNTQNEVFPEFVSHPKISLRRIIGIRNAGAHGDRVTEDSVTYLDYCATEMLSLLKPKTHSQSAASETPAPIARRIVPPLPDKPSSPPTQIISPLLDDVVAPPTPPTPPAHHQYGMRQILAFYVVCDKSASMAGDAIDAVNHSLAEMHRVLISDPVVADRCWMSVVSFSSSAKVELALTPPHQVVAMPHIDAEGITNYGAAFSLVKSQIDDDLPRVAQTHRPLRPLVFFVTDGSPSDKTWKNEFIRLVDAGELYAPTVIVIAVGHVDETVLAEFRNVPTGIPPHILRLDNGIELADSVRHAIQSITNSVVGTLRNDDDLLTVEGLDMPPTIELDPDEQ
jgi:uncharacterized protein YegL